MLVVFSFSLFIGSESLEPAGRGPGDIMESPSSVSYIIISCIIIS